MQNLLPFQRATGSKGRSGDTSTCRLLGRGLKKYMEAMRFIYETANAEISFHVETIVFAPSREYEPVTYRK